MAKKSTKKVADIVEENIVVEESVIDKESVTPIEEPIEEKVVVNVTEEKVEYTPQEPEPSIDDNLINPEVKFEFQKDYDIGGGDPTKEAEIDVLPNEEPVVDYSEEELNETPDDDGFYEVKAKLLGDDLVSVEPQAEPNPNVIVEYHYENKKPQKKSISSLSAAEFKTYQRTGILPNQ